MAARLRGGNDPRLWEKTRGAVDWRNFPKAWSRYMEMG